MYLDRIDISDYFVSVPFGLTRSNCIDFKEGSWSFLKKKMVSRSISKKGYLKISRTMSKSEFTEWIFHWCIHHFQEKYASPDCPIWHSIGIWNHVFFQQARQQVIWRHIRHLVKSSEFGNLIKTVARELVYVPVWSFPMFFAKSKKNLIPIHYVHFHMPLIRNFTFPTRKIKNIFLTDLFTSHPYMDWFFVFFW